MQRQGGRVQLAAATGLSLTTISRTLDGKTLPLPSQLTTWATILGLDHRRVLVDSGLIPAEHGPEPAIRQVTSAPLTPDEAMDAWGIADPKIRLVRDMQEREDDIHQREEAQRRRTVVTALRLASMARSLDDTRDENRRLKVRVAELEQEIDEVNDERNQLVARELALTSTQFAPRAYGDLRGAAHLTVWPRKEHRSSRS